MSKFVLEPLNDVKGTVQFFKILEDEECYWNGFCLTIEEEGNYPLEINKLKYIMDQVSNNERLPYKKFHPMDDPPDPNCYEVKSKHLRAYIFKDSQGYIILFAGKKTDQNEDINRFRTIRDRYLSTKPHDIKRKIN